MRRARLREANKAKAVQSRVKALERMEAPETYVQRRSMTGSFAPPQRASALHPHAPTPALRPHQFSERKQKP